VRLLARKTFKIGFLFLFLYSLPVIADETNQINLVDVDLQLVLAVDVSQSVDTEEGVLQRQGYIEALLDSDVINTIQTGRFGRIALSYTEWAGPLDQWIVVDWQIIDGELSALEFVKKLNAAPIRTGQRTSISYGILHAITLFRKSGFRAERKVIDVSGDGANNAGFYVHVARNRAVDNGITINGLAIMNGKSSPLGIPATKNIDNYYEDCVIAGPGAFIVVAENLRSFSSAVRRKMILEIAGLMPRYRALHSSSINNGIALSSFSYESSDCMVGEKQFETFRKNLLRKN
jgi:hypothetical protein